MDEELKSSQSDQIDDWGNFDAAAACLLENGENCEACQ